jgi:hypothetical protein
MLRYKAKQNRSPQNPELYVCVASARTGMKRRCIVKTIVVVLSLAISGVAISAAYFDAYASRMNGWGNGCSDGNHECKAEDGHY